MDILELKAQVRQEKGKNQIKQLRAEGLLPANVYGYQAEATNIAVNGREFGNLIHSSSGTHVILKLVIDNGKSPTVIVKDIQRHPVRDDLIHVDFLSVALDEKIVAAVPLSIVGDSVGVREGGILQHGLWEVQVEALPMDLPDHLELDVSGLAVGESLHAGDIDLPPKLTMVTGAEEVVASVLAPTVYKEEEEAAEEEAAEAAAAEKEEEGSSAPEASEES
jgi:large subunit ribosomal protein L25